MLITAKSNIIKKFDNFLNDGSGWAFDECDSMDIAISDYQPSEEAPNI